MSKFSYNVEGPKVLSYETNSLMVLYYDFDPNSTVVLETKITQQQSNLILNLFERIASQIRKYNKFQKDESKPN